MRTNCSLLRVGTLAFLLGTTGLHATVTAIFDNLDTSNGPGSQTINPAFWFAQSFVVGNTDYTLSSVALSVGDTENATGNFVIRLYEANQTDGGPGNVFVEMNAPPNPNPESAGVYEYFPAEPKTLNHDTTYYVSFGVTSDGGTYFWDYELGRTPETGNEVGYRISNDRGANWTTSPSTFLVFSMQVNGEIIPVPEPVNVALGIFGALLVGAWSFGWRNSRQQ